MPEAAFGHRLPAPSHSRCEVDRKAQANANMANGNGECFWPQGAKNITPKGGSDGKGQQFEENQVWHAGCIRYFHGVFFQRTSNLLRAIWRRTRGVNTAEHHHDLQLTCQ